MFTKNKDYDEFKERIKLKRRFEFAVGFQFFVNYFFLVWMILISLRIIQLDTFLNMTILFLIPFIVLFSGEFLTFRVKSILKDQNRFSIQVVLTIIVVFSILSIILFEGTVISLLQQQEATHIFLKRVYFLLIFSFLLLVLQFLYSVDFKELKTRQNTYGIEIKLFLMNLLFILSLLFFHFSLINFF